MSHDYDPSFEPPEQWYGECRSETQAPDGRWVDGRWVGSDPLPFCDGAAVRFARRVKDKASFHLFMANTFLRHTLPDKIAMQVAWWLPREVALWAYIRVMAHATQGPYGNQHVDDVRYSDAYKRWEKGPHDEHSEVDIAMDLYEEVMKSSEPA